MPRSCGKWIEITGQSLGAYTWVYTYLANNTLNIYIKARYRRLAAELNKRHRTLQSREWSFLQVFSEREIILGYRSMFRE